MTETIGRQLRQAREERNLTLEQVAQATHIRLHYLEALERGDFSRLPSKAQGRGFLRAYAGYLGLNPEPLLSSLDGEAPISPVALPSDALPEPLPGAQASLESATLIFAEVGQRLHERRELLGLSLEEVERNTRLRQHYLQALEAGDLDGLPSPVQGRGMLYNYATFLSLDPEPLLLRYADGLQVRLAEKQAKRPKRPSPRSTRQPTPASLRRLLSSDYLIGGVLGLSLIGFMIWGAIRINTLRRSEQPSATVPSIAEALRITPEVPSSEVPTASALPTEARPTQGTLPAVPDDTTEQPDISATPVATGPGEGSAPVQIYITVLHRAWLRVTVDGVVEFEGRVGPGNAYTFAGEVQIEVLTGNGAALQLFFNQTDLGVLGVYGEVVYRIFTKDGMVLPTPTITSTPTPTRAATATPVATEQPQPTPLP
ncbi:MAG: hypothetical protein A2Z45_08075 [Chloroflexi bacterium RBG_19FT_COMBO_55_16]|nr:MAG: hypothetical protein A2Z45_08075 [Chloroflexi bacterium RBG_19FT_COMBO_55_16]